ncbi:MAG: TylF/MycF/NovP-related O-methyltransferase [Acidobacteriota bacterium]
MTDRELIARVRPNTYLPRAKLRNLLRLVRDLRRRGVAGDIVECGVYRGGSAGLLAYACAGERHTWLFDSFAGLPQPTAEDAGGRLLGRETGERCVARLVRKPDAPLRPINHCVGTREEVEALLFETGLMIERKTVTVIQGWFQETLAPACARIPKIALLHLDGDWYESTAVCLKHLFDLVAAGGWVVVDDYGYWHGCRKAVDEFLALRKLAPCKHNIGSAIYFQAGEY